MLGKEREKPEGTASAKALRWGRASRARNLGQTGPIGEEAAAFDFIPVAMGGPWGGGYEVKQGSNCPAPLKCIYYFDFVSLNALQIFQEFRGWRRGEGIPGLSLCASSRGGSQASRRQSYWD